MVYKIKQINPVTAKEWEEVNLKFLEFFKNPDTEISIVTLDRIPNGPKEISNSYNVAQVLSYTLEEAERAQKEGFDAILMSCFGDIGVDVMREALDIPVVGGCQAAVHLASLLGTKFSILSLGGERPEGRRTSSMDNINKYGFKSKLASVRHVNLTPLQIAETKEELKKQLVVEAKKAISEDGADVLILGCGGMNVHLWLQEQVGVPVIDPLIASLKLLEILGKMKLTHSKLAYPTPPQVRAR